MNIELYSEDYFQLNDNIYDVINDLDYYKYTYNINTIIDDWINKLNLMETFLYIFLIKY